jgi:hypothetical protein
MFSFPNKNDHRLSGEKEDAGNRSRTSYLTIHHNEQGRGACRIPSQSQGEQQRADDGGIVGFTVPLCPPEW